MRGNKRYLFAAVCALGTILASQAQSNFMPEAANSIRRASLKAGGGAMPLIEGELEGKKCVLIFDTGATHTTFDANFIRENFPQKKLEKVLLGGTTNVESSPELAHADKLKLGEAQFDNFDIMVLDLGGVARDSGNRVDGVLGMNVIGTGRTLVSLGGGEIIFGASKESREGFAPAKRVALYDPLTLTLAVKPMGEKQGDAPRPIIIDSGSSFTFLDEGFGWPKGEAKHEIMARDVNGRSMLEPAEGQKGNLKFLDGGEISIKPLISQEPLNRIGVDTLRVYDMLIEPRCIGFRPHKAKEEGEK
ncbi:MAG: retropepsin-like domain-containing protein [Kiritimatiellae bacterium]|nr:retropepsin-like domain-containing protein [Kiritimatiellia bacterium]